MWRRRAWGQAVGDRRGLARRSGHHTLTRVTGGCWSLETDLPGLSRTSFQPTIRSPAVRPILSPTRRFRQFAPGGLSFPGLSSPAPSRPLPLPQENSASSDPRPFHGRNFLARAVPSFPNRRLFYHKGVAGDGPFKNPDHKLNYNYC